MNRVTNDKRLASIRFFVQKMILAMPDTVKKQEATVRLNGVSVFASMLALRRGHNPELAAIAGLLHRFYTYKTGVNEFAGLNSAEAVRPFLRDLKLFSNDEQQIILRAIFYHEERSLSHGPYEEIMKDAYVLQCYFQKSTMVLDQHVISRLENVFGELMIPDQLLDGAKDNVQESEYEHSDFGGLLANIAVVMSGKVTIIRFFYRLDRHGLSLALQCF